MSTAIGQANSVEHMPRKLPVWSAPLVPVAMAMTAGIVADRSLIIPWPASLGAAFAFLCPWIIFTGRTRHRFALLYLWVGVAALAAAYHHWHRHADDAGDVRHFAAHDGKPVRLRGTLNTAPIKQPGQHDPLRSFP